MNEQTEFLEKQIQQIAADFTFPPTPDIAQNVRAQLEVDNQHVYVRPQALAWAMLLVIVLSVGLLMVPQVRAAALRFFNIGAITIFEMEEAEKTAVITATKPTQALIEQLGIAKSISMDEASAQTTSFYLPTDLHEPDQLYLYESESGWPPTIISVWQLDKGPDLALYQIEATQFAYKGSTFFEETAVNGQRAMWIEGAHPFRLHDNRWQEWQFVPGKVLVWGHKDDLTFRLEGADTLDEAITIAESLEKVEK